MITPNALILRAAGTNCDRETAHAFELAGAQVEFVHINRLLEHPAELDRFQVLAIPGGFTYGDDIAAGKILANQMVHHLADTLKRFVERGRLVMGICNGFQVLVKTGLLPGWEGLGSQSVTLTNNDSNKFECRWVTLESPGSRSVFFPESGTLRLPIAHAEGKFVTDAPKTLRRLAEDNQIVFRYAPPSESKASEIRDLKSETRKSKIKNPKFEIKYNPNGSQDDIAGICDHTGRVLGMMPHPERYVRPQQHPQWTRGQAVDEGEGLALFVNAVKYLKS